MSEPLLQVRDLWVSYASRNKRTSVVRGLNFDIDAGEIVGLVGESGSGKSTVAKALIGLCDPGAEVTGSVVVRGVDLLQLSEPELRRHRGVEVSMIGQDPLSALNPSHRVIRQVTEGISDRMSRSDARARGLGLLGEVGLPDPSYQARRYPHELSGGMRQRVMTALALAGEPVLLLADEPTTALDTTIQAQILALLSELRQRHGTAMLFITHDLNVVAELAQRILVMYAGELIEVGPTRSVFENPRHPYTRGLLAATPSFRRSTRRLVTIPGQAPGASEFISGCTFAPRCPAKTALCEEKPDLSARGAATEHQDRCVRSPQLGSVDLWGARS